MSKRKSLLIKMVFVSMLVFIANMYSPSASFAAGECYVSDTYCDEETEKSDAKSEDNQQENSATKSSIGIFDYIKVLLALGVVIALLIFVLKFINRKNAAYQQNSLMKNLGGISVGPQKSLQLVQIGNRLYIVGVGENISLIREIEDPNEMEQILNFYDGKQHEISTVPFLTEILTKLKPQKNNSQEQSASFNDLFNAKLKNIKQERTQDLEGWKEKEKDRYE